MYPLPSLAFPLPPLPFPLPPLAGEGRDGGCAPAH